MASLYERNAFSTVRDGLGAGRGNPTRACGYGRLRPASRAAKLIELATCGPPSVAVSTRQGPSGNEGPPATSLAFRRCDDGRVRCCYAPSPAITAVSVAWRYSPDRSRCDALQRCLIAETSTSTRDYRSPCCDCRCKAAAVAMRTPCHGHGCRNGNVGGNRNRNRRQRLAHAVNRRRVPASATT